MECTQESVDSLNRRCLDVYYAIAVLEEQIQHDSYLSDQSSEEFQSRAAAAPGGIPKYNAPSVSLKR